ncbi:MAG: HD-GYP domain-containing protein [Firmicutes bacterium]|nr:HD-GYP domain-containing protein [Bacillota bacterium]
MRKIDIGQVRPGMVVARPIFGSEGQCLLNKGVIIKSYYIRHLIDLDVSYIYIHDDRLEGVVVKDVISEETRLEACHIVKQMIKVNDEVQGRRVTSRICKLENRLIKIVTRIIDELFYNKDTVVNLVDIRSADDYTFAHSVNVCVLSTLMGIKLDFSRHKICKLALGSMLHDLGKTKTPGEILKKPGFLTEEEYEVVKRHPDQGLELFKENSVFSDMAGKIISQHHERYNGRGYPLGLKGDEIDPLAQIVAIADVYDALTSDRPYRKAYQPHEAIEMFSVSGSNHNVEYLRIFLSFIAGYPVGTTVNLSNDESGLVIANTPGYPLRPVVRVLYEGGDLMLPHSAPYELDMTEKLDIVVTGIVDGDYENLLS